MTEVLGEAPAATGWTVDDSTFAARLALVRHRMGWNVKEAAREVGVPAASWRSWEEGANPHRKVEIAERIAERVGCDDVWLAMGRRLTTYAPSRATTPARDPNERLRPVIKRPRRHVQKTISERLARHPCPNRRPQTSRTAPSPTGPPSQRRPALIASAG